MSLEQPSLAERYQRTLDAVSDYANKYQRQAATIKLIAVSKQHAAERVIELIKLGHRDFAENYLQESIEKISQVTHAVDKMGERAMTDKPCWHFIGHIQSRKCKQIAEHFDWVHTVDSAKVAQKLNQHRAGCPPLNVLIQLNLQQSIKAGIRLEELPELVDVMQGLHNLNLRGLMMIPEMETDFEKQRAIFRRCRQALEQLAQLGHNLKGTSIKQDFFVSARKSRTENRNVYGIHEDSPMNIKGRGLTPQSRKKTINRGALDQLSIGMSADLEAAIAEGATQLRIGTAIFGARLIRKK